MEWLVAKPLSLGQNRAPTVSFYAQLREITRESLHTGLP